MRLWISVLVVAACSDDVAPGDEGSSGASTQSSSATTSGDPTTAVSSSSDATTATTGGSASGDMTADASSASEDTSGPPPGEPGSLRFFGQGGTYDDRVLVRVDEHERLGEQQHRRRSRSSQPAAVVRGRDRRRRDGVGVQGGAGDPWSMCGGTDVLDDAWHHIAVQRRRSDGWLWLYVDGQLDAEVDGPDGDATHGEIRYGGDPPGPEWSAETPF